MANLAQANPEPTGAAGNGDTPLNFSESDAGNTRPVSAVALAYRANQTAPRVVAKGNGLLAEAIIARAKSSGVFVHESPTLVALLMQVDIDKDIPPSLYVAVAQLLAWIYRLENGLDTSVQSQ